MVLVMDTFIREIAPGVALHRDPASGLAWAQWEVMAPVQDSQTFEVTGHSPRIVRHYVHSTASAIQAPVFLRDEVHGWKKNHRTVTGPDGRIVNISSAARINATIDAILHSECQCGGVHAQR